MSQLGKSSGTGGPPVRLGDIAKARMGKTILSKELTDTGVPVYSAGRDNEPWGYVPTSDLLFGEETIVIAARGNIGFPRVPRITPFVSTQTTIAISFKDSRNVPYLRYQLETVNWPGMTSQTTIPMVTVRQVEDIEVRLPHLDEQRRIVAEIEKQFTRLEAEVAALRRVQANLKRYRAAVLKAACEGQLVPTEAELSRSQPSTKNSQPAYEPASKLLARILAERRKNWTGRGKYKEPAAPDTANLPPLPEGWTWASVEQISTKVVDGVHKKPNYVPSGVPFVTVRNLTAGPGISFEKLNYITPEDHEEFIKRANPEPGDILVSKDGTLGVIRVIKTDVTFSIFVSVAMVKPVLREMSNFLGHALSAPQVQAQMIPKGSGLQHIHLEDLREDCVPLPPLTEQTRIVAEVERRLSVVEELESVVSANLQRATRLRQSILQKAFTGELVKPEPAIDLATIIPPIKPEHIHKPNRHFARALLSAEIVHRLHNEPTFGRIKHQKIFHLCEHIAQIEGIEGQYHRELAGPLDNKLIYANEAELKKQKWYQEVHRQSFGHAYEPMAKAGVHRKYVEGYWPDKLPIIEKLIELMRTWDTDRCEIFCTAYAAWNDLLLWGKDATDAAILHEILNRWHDSKRRFPQERWLKAIHWMKEKGFVPTGFGKPTSKPA